MRAGGPYAARLDPVTEVTRRDFCRIPVIRGYGVWHLRGGGERLAKDGTHSVRVFKGQLTRDTRCSLSKKRDAKVCEVCGGKEPDKSTGPFLEHLKPWIPGTEVGEEV